MVTFIINGLPSSLLDWNTHFELLSKASAHYDMLKVFGVNVMSQTLIPTRINLVLELSNVSLLGIN